MITPLSLSGISTCLYTGDDLSPPNSLVGSDPKCATVSESGVSFSVHAPGSLTVQIIGLITVPTGSSPSVIDDNDCNKTFISIGESKTCTVTFRYG